MNKKPQKNIEHSISKAKILFIVFQILFVALIFILWFSSGTVRERRELWILFLAAFPSNFISGFVPYDPLVIYFAKYYSPFIIVPLSVFSMLVVEAINYSIFHFMTYAKFIVKFRHSPFIDRMIRLFNKSPFLTLIVTQLIPVPFYPLRILVVLANYPVIKFLFTVLLSKIPRMLFLVLIGNRINIPDHLIFLFFIVVSVSAYIGFFINRLREKRVFKSKTLSRSG